MSKTFLTAAMPDSATQATVDPDSSQEQDRDKIKILVIGSSHSVERVIHELYRVGFAEVREWSKPLPTGNYGEVMRILTRYVIVE